MGWHEVKSIEELKALGKLREVSLHISMDLEGERVPKTSWETLWQFVQEKQQALKELSKPQWQRVESLQAFKAIGSFNELRRQINEVIAPEKVTVRSWEELWELAQDIKLSGMTSK